MHRLKCVRKKMNINRSEKSHVGEAYFWADLTECKLIWHSLKLSIELYKFLAHQYVKYWYSVHPKLHTLQQYTI